MDPREVAHSLANLADGVYTVVTEAPGQLVRTVRMTPPRSLWAAVSGYQESSATKALPFVAAGIALVVGYNIWRQSKS